jgi:hypothetical protein
MLASLSAAGPGQFQAEEGRAGAQAASGLPARGRWTLAL